MVGRKESGFSCCCTIPRERSGGGGIEECKNTGGSSGDGCDPIDRLEEGSMRDSHVSCTFTGDQGASKHKGSLIPCTKLLPNKEWSFKEW